MILEFDQTSTGCTVAGHSRSQNLSYFDHSTNFCNVWNVFNQTWAPFDLTTGKCSFPAADPQTTCYNW